MPGFAHLQCPAIAKALNFTPLAVEPIQAESSPTRSHYHRPLDGDGSDASGNNLGGTPTNADWVAGLYNLAFRFTGDDALVVPPDRHLDLNTLTMSAWLRPVDYDLADNADRGIIMNKESSYEMGLQDETGALQGAFSPCWRWFGETRIPIHEWTHVAMGFDGANELHYVHGVHQETDPCPGALTPSPDPLRLGARSNSVSFADASFAHASQFQGDVDEVMLFSRSLSEMEISNLQAANYRTGGGMTNVYAAGEPDASLLPAGCAGFWVSPCCLITFPCFRFRRYLTCQANCWDSHLTEQARTLRLGTTRNQTTKSGSKACSASRFASMAMTRCGFRAAIKRPQNLGTSI